MSSWLYYDIETEPQPVNVQVLCSECDEVIYINKGVTNDKFNIVLKAQPHVCEEVA